MISNPYMASFIFLSEVLKQRLVQSFPFQNVVII